MSNDKGANPKTEAEQPADNGAAPAAEPTDWKAKAEPSN